MSEDFDSTVASFDAARKQNNRTLIIVIVVLVVLCCCCVGSLALLWYTGDAMLEMLGIPVSSLLLQLL